MREHQIVKYWNVMLIQNAYFYTVFFGRDSIVIDVFPFRARPGHTEDSRA